jgi:hypothetical protein
MANFSAIITGATATQWVDAVGARPSRLNPASGLSHIYLACAPFTNLIITCTDPYGNNPGPADATLGGNLFSGAYIETPSFSVPAIVTTFGFSSIMQTRPLTPGHYLFGIFRPLGGAVFLHFTCE